MKRAIIIVLDSFGVGELPDADKYGDVGSNTLGNIAKNIKGFKLPNLQKMGIGNIDGVDAFNSLSKVTGNYGKMAEQSAGKDTTTGHWEISGLRLERPFPTYPNGFPYEIINEFKKQIGSEILGNIVASGTEIINTLGKEHMRTGFPIIYTSADSVFQIAAHEDIIPIEKQYEICIKARNILTGRHAVGRVIARPFIGQEGHFTRTDKRRDFSVDPIGKTIMDYVKEAGLQVKAVGKIEDIFNKRGITKAVHTHNNMDGVDRTIEYLKENSDGIIFTNLVDFDMIYGHRNDVAGYANALMEFDHRLTEIIENLKDEDILFITADHGCDPTTKSTDHSREYVPLLVYGKKIKSNINLGVRNTYSDIAATIADFLEVKADLKGESFYASIRNN